MELFLFHEIQAVLCVLKIGLIYLNLYVQCHFRFILISFLACILLKKNAGLLAGIVSRLPSDCRKLRQNKIYIK